jgi:uncharacterized phage protein gp47/JayE
MALLGAVLRRSVVFILSRVIAGAAHMLHGHLEFLGLQLFPDKSEGAFLVRQASLFNIFPKEAAYAIGATVPITGTNGTVIPIHTILRRSDGAEYQTDAEVTISGGLAHPTITALVAGAIGNADAGVVLSFESPIAGADASITVGGEGLIDGSDEETTEELRSRLIARMRAAPNGGSKADFEAWSLEVAGVTRAWVYPLELGAGTVVVRFVRDDDVSLIPDSGEVAILQAHLDTVRPVTAAVTVVAPSAVALALSVHISPDNSTTRAAVTAALGSVILEDAEPGSTLLLSHLRDAVGNAAGVDDYTMASPVADVTHSTGQLATLGVITFT